LIAQALRKALGSGCRLPGRRCQMTVEWSAEMDQGVLGIEGQDARRLGARWLLICDIVGGIAGAAIAIALLVVVLS
jgi:hypothetical protein